MPLWARLVVVIGGAKVALGMTLYLSGLAVRSAPAPVPVWIYAALSTAFAVLGGLLVVGNRHDPRASWLGGVLVLVAAPLTPLVNSFPAQAWTAASHVRPDALAAAFLWNFLAEFPSPLTGAPRRIVRWAGAVALAVGCWCAFANLSVLWIPHSSNEFWRSPFLIAGWYWTLYFGMLVLVPFGLLWRARTASVEDRPRMQLFVRGLVVGVLPFSIEIIVEELVPAHKTFVVTPGIQPIVGAILFGSLAMSRSDRGPGCSSIGSLNRRDVVRHWRCSTAGAIRKPRGQMLFGGAT